MRVLFLAHSFPRAPGDAAGSFLLRLAVALREAGVAVRVVAPAAPGLAPRDTIEGIEVVRYRYAPRGWETLAYTGTMADAVQGSAAGKLALLGMLAASAAAVRREARAWGAEVIHAHWWFPGALALTLPLLGATRPVVLTMHGSDVRLAVNRPAAPRLYARVARRMAAVTAVSRWLASEAEAMAPDVRCEVGPMPVAADLFAPPAADAPREGALFVGRLNAQKGVDALLRATAAQRLPAPLTIVGSGPDEASLRALAASLGIAERVRWVPAQPQPALAAHYRAARVLVVPSREEGLGLVAVEAQLCGTPVVAFASGGLTDVVHDGVDGLLVPPGDEAALARAVDALLADPSRAADLGAAGRATALATFAPAAVATRYRALYERVAR